jgi:hypothetical protein
VIRIYVPLGLEIPVSVQVSCPYDSTSGHQLQLFRKAAKMKKA